MLKKIGWIDLAGSGSRTEKMVLRHSVILALTNFNIPGDGTSSAWECFASLRAGDKIETVKATKVVEWIYHDVVRLALEVPSDDGGGVGSDLSMRWQKCVTLHDKLLRGLISPVVYKEKRGAIAPQNDSYPRGSQDYYLGSWSHHLAMQRGDQNPDPLEASFSEDRFRSKRGFQALVYGWSGHQESMAGELHLWKLSGSTEPYPTWSKEVKNTHLRDRVEALYKVLRLGYLSVLISSRLGDLFPDPWSTELLEHGAEEGRRCMQWVRSCWAEETHGADFPNPPAVSLEVVNKTVLDSLLV